MRIIESKAAKGLCCAYRCGKKKAYKQKFCHKHKGRQNKKANLLYYTFRILKGNAKRRGKLFTLTLEQFGSFCTKTKYLDLKGRLPTSASIDRIDPSRGYEVGNLQILSLSENSEKGEDDPF